MVPKLQDFKNKFKSLQNVTLYQTDVVYLQKAENSTNVIDCFENIHNFFTISLEPFDYQERLLPFKNLILLFKSINREAAGLESDISEQLVNNVRLEFLER